jgi:hypothetical protein
LGPIGTDGTLSQVFADIAGGQYTFSFWLAAVGDDPSDFTAYLDGSVVYAATDPNTSGNWVQIGLDFVGHGFDTISFAFRDDPGYIALDNVVAQPAREPVPEPGSLLLLATPALSVAGVVRRRVRR